MKHDDTPSYQNLTKYSGVKLSTDWFSARGVELSSDGAVPGVRIGQ